MSPESNSVIASQTIHLQNNSKNVIQKWKLNLNSLCCCDVWRITVLTQWWRSALYLRWSWICSILILSFIFNKLIARPIRLAEWLLRLVCFSLVNMPKNTNVIRSVREGARKFPSATLCPSKLRFHYLRDQHGK